jgi:hypothetical protein
MTEANRVWWPVTPGCSVTGRVWPVTVHRPGSGPITYLTPHFSISTHFYTISSPFSNPTTFFSQISSSFSILHYQNLSQSLNTLNEVCSTRHPLHHHTFGVSYHCRSPHIKFFIRNWDFLLQIPLRWNLILNLFSYTKWIVVFWFSYTSYIYIITCMNPRNWNFRDWTTIHQNLDFYHI